MSETKPQTTTNQLKRMDKPKGLSPFIDLLQIDSLEVADGKGRLELVIQERHLRPLNIAHGGVVLTLLDTIIGMAAHTGAPPDHYGVTVQLNVNFTRPAWVGEKIIFTSETLHSGKQTAVGRGEARTDKGVLVAHGSGTFMYIPHTDQTREMIKQVDDTAIEQARHC